MEGERVEADDVREPSRALSHEELLQLQERARARLADPDYQRRLRATDRLAQAFDR